MLSQDVWDVHYTVHVLLKEITNPLTKSSFFPLSAEADRVLLAPLHSAITALIGGTTQAVRGGSSLGNRKHSINEQKHHQEVMLMA